MMISRIVRTRLGDGRYDEIALVEARRGPLVPDVRRARATSSVHVIQSAVSSRSLSRGQAAALPVTVLAPWTGNVIHATEYPGRLPDRHRPLPDELRPDVVQLRDPRCGGTVRVVEFGEVGTTIRPVTPVAESAEQALGE
jgi:hypothetical protein